MTSLGSASETDRRALLRAYREKGDTAARDRLIAEFLPLVRSLARRYAGYRDFMYIGRGLGHPVATHVAQPMFSQEINHLQAEKRRGRRAGKTDRQILDSFAPATASGPHLMLRNIWYAQHFG